MRPAAFELHFILAQMRHSAMGRLTQTSEVSYAELPLQYDAAFSVPFSGALAWIALWIVASIFYRRSKGKSLFPQKPDHAVFYESTGSGRSNRNFFTRLGGARNCLTVAVTDNLLIVQPKFPFNLMFLPEIYGLEYSIPKNRIHTIEEKKFFFGKGVTLGFTLPDGSEHSIELRLRGMDQLLKVLAHK